MSGTRRRRLVVGLGIAGVLVAVVVALGLTGRGGDSPTGDRATAGTTAGGTSTSSGPAGPATGGPAVSSGGSATASATGTSSAPSAGIGQDVGAAEVLPPDLPAVPLDATASVPGTVAGRLVSVEAVQASGTGVGNVSGPALRVTVELTGGGSRTVPLDGSFVELTTGPELTPASPVDDPSAVPLQGELAPDGTATGVYVFGVGEGDRGDVTVRVQPAPGDPFLVFRGAAG